MSKRNGKILVVDDDQVVLRAVTEILGRAGHQVVAVADATEGLTAAREPSVDVVVLDVRRRHPAGMDLLAAIQQSRPEVEVVVMTATVDAAVEAVKAGAYDYLTQPFENPEEVALTVGKALERRLLKDRTRVLEEALSARGQPTGGGEAEVNSLAHLPYGEAKKLAMRAFERRYLATLLERSKNNISSAARAAGMDRSNFRRLLKQYDVGRNLPASEAGEGSHSVPRLHTGG